MPLSYLKFISETFLLLALNIQRNPQTTLQFLFKNRGIKLERDLHCLIGIYHGGLVMNIDKLWNQGYRAYLSQETIEHCPYDEKEYIINWIKGYLDAANDSYHEVSG
ncbi:hypothetical protein BIT28_12755 [Photobacterium proteolyticum]|uniref:Uncharacterized protein n=2 Tax=Photobacterium proteolyticum TaxID=1903952 RepID=A0A1Q9GJZ5_9GAMM|nr:hypothetical protein BIT28_12755 [Photobacterium proteolyticum]